MQHPTSADPGGAALVAPASVTYYDRMWYDSMHLVDNTQYDRMY